MGAIEGARASAGSARASARLRCPQSLEAALGRCGLGPLGPVGPLCRLRCRGAGCCGPRRGACGGPWASGLLPPGRKRLLRAFSRAEVLGIPAPGKDSPSSALAPRRPSPKQPRPGSCNAGLGKWEQRPSGAVGGGGGRSVFFKPFPAFQA